MISVLKQLREILGDTYRDFLEVYLDDTPKSLEQMQSALKDADFETIATVAHTLRGSSINFGAQKLSDTCAEIEKLARANTIEGLEEKILEVVEVYQDVRSILEQEYVACR